MSPPPLLLLPLFSLISLFSLSSAYTATLTLSPTAAAPPLTNPWQKLAHLAAASSARAHHLKHPKSNLSATKAPLLPRSYGGYSIHLGFGTPPQTFSFIMDTGSSLVWLPCGRRYSCKSCNTTGFLPKSSSSSKILGCRNPKCKWVFPDLRCSGCDNNSTRCYQRCPPYSFEYQSGSTTGSLLSDSLVFPDNQTVENFLIGCSIFSTEQPTGVSGIAGFGRGPESLPSQMKLKRFSYCLISHRFDNEPVSSDLVLNGAAAAGRIKYTPFRKNPTTANPAFLHYYYVTLRKITVGGVKVEAPYKYLVPDSGGNGGTIVDSGSSFTSMEKEVFELVAEEFEKQIGKKYRRAAAVEKKSGLLPCYNISGVEETVDLPQLKFHFKGGAKMALPMADYFSLREESVICMTIVSSQPGPGPAIILGNYQQQDFYMEYDLEHERLGFKSQVCK